MNSLSAHVQTLLRESLLVGSECVVVSYEKLSKIWPVVAKTYSAPAWKRFSVFMQSFGQQFDAGEPDNVSGERRYKAHIIMMLLFDCAGLKVDSDDFNDFLQAWKDADSCRSPTPDPLLSHSLPSMSLDDDSQATSSQRPDMSVAMFPKAGRSAVAGVVSRLRSGSFSDASQYSHGEVASLVTALNQSNADCARLRSEKKSLQQQNRRLAGRIMVLEEEAVKTAENNKRKRDFDLHRVNDVETKN